MGKIILGSSSPRRADILKKLNIEFDVIPSSYVEKHDRTDFSYGVVENLAYNKARAVAEEYGNKKDFRPVIGADTIVVLDNKILGKPKDYEEAFLMLKSLSGKTHFVVTAVCVINPETMKSRTECDTTYVTFHDLSDKQIENYIKNFKPYDKAGAYGIQELPDGFVKNVKGDRDNVIGLPSKLVLKLLKAYI